MVVADLGQTLVEHSRDPPAGGVVASTHAALVHHLSWAEVVVAARTLWDAGGKVVSNDDSEQLRDQTWGPAEFNKKKLFVQNT